MHSTLGVIPTISEKDAAHLLVTESALGQLVFEDALRVIGYMKPKRIKVGSVFIREGEKASTDFMMLLMAGEARVESLLPGASEAITMSVIGAGHLLGEIGMLNGTARSATCTASTELAVAVLSRASLGKMMREEPDLAARFLLAVSSRMAERLRETTAKLKKFMQLNTVLHNEVYTLMDSQDKARKPNAKKPAPGYEATEPMSLSPLFSANMPEAEAPAKKPARRSRSTDFAALPGASRSSR